MAYTQATNFIDSLKSTVDVRTGAFLTELDLLTVTANQLRGPALALKLRYRPFSDKDLGLGIGWNLDWSTYDNKKKELDAASGEHLLVASDTSNGELPLRQSKLASVSMFKHSDSAYHVFHSTGFVETLSGQSNAYSVKVPLRLGAPGGAAIGFRWSGHADNYWFEGAFNDLGNDLARIAYDGDSSAVLTVLPGSASQREIQLLFSQRQLVAVIDGDRYWAFTYDRSIPNVPAVLCGIDYPDGLIERVEYEGQGHRYPEIPGAPLVRVPYVITHALDPGAGQPKISYEMEYTSHNYLGYGAGLAAYGIDGDNLYDSPDEDYLYGSTFRQLTAGEPEVTTRYFNKYHLEVKRTRVCGECIQVTDFIFGNLKKHVDFLNQQSSFQSPTEIRRTYSDASGSRVEAETMTYDDRGRLSTHVARDGLLNTWTYYSVEGAPGRCPPDPAQLGSFVESVTITANDDHGVASKKSTVFTYVQIKNSYSPKTGDSPSPYSIFPWQQDDYADDRHIRGTEFSYVEAVGSDNHGRVKSIVDRLYTNDQCFEYRQFWRYSIDAVLSTLTVEQTTTSFDGKSRKYFETRDIDTGSVLAREDYAGVRSAYAYDTRGREVRRIDASGSPYERCWTKEYGKAAIVDGGGEASYTRTASPEGVVLRDWTDGLGRQILREILVDDRWETLQRATYDSEGNLSTWTEQDLLPNAEGVHSPVQWSVHFFYDNWGLAAGQSKDGGRRQKRVNDVVGLKQYDIRSTGAAEVLEYDARTYRVSRRTRRDSADIVSDTTVYQYDVFGRLILVTEDSTRTRQYAYDDFDRITETTLEDGTSIKKGYAPHCISPLMISVAVNNFVIGEQTFDGLMRLTSRVSGGRKRAYFYKKSLPCPQSIREPDGRQWTYEYLPEIGNALASQKTPDGAFERCYHYGACSELVIAEEKTVPQGPTLVRSYTGWGSVVEETLDYDDVPSMPGASTEFSFGNRVIGYTDMTGDKCSYAFDSFGRVIAKTHSDMSLHTRYDEDGRVVSWDVEAGERSSSTTLERDDFDRETSRETTYGQGGKQLKIEQSWYGNDQRSGRGTYIDGSLVRQEGYTYDERGRLTIYTCDGPRPPDDPYREGVREQHFEYDALGNIRTLRTVFDDDENTSTYGFDNPLDPCQLTGVTHSHADYPAPAQLTYDLCGRMIVDDSGRRLGYDAFGRLATLESARAHITYSYDATDVLRVKSVDSKSQERYFYRDGKLITVVEKSGMAAVQTRLLRAGSEVFVQNGQEADPLILASDDKGSVIAAEEAADTVAGYLPYGFRTRVPTNRAIIGFNGEPVDEDLGGYHLGNGYRVYSPSLMRFISPDSWSPFGAGGINAYAYCAGDPVNTADPSGHLSGTDWASIGILGTTTLILSLVGILTLGGGTLIGTALTLGVLAINASSAGLQIAAVVEGSFAESHLIVDGSGRAVIKDNNLINQANTLAYISTGFSLAASIASVAGLSLYGGGVFAKFRSLFSRNWESRQGHSEDSDSNTGSGPLTLAAIETEAMVLQEDMLAIQTDEMEEFGESGSPSAIRARGTYDHGKFDGKELRIGNAALPRRSSELEQFERGQVRAQSIALGIGRDGSSELPDSLGGVAFGAASAFNGMGERPGLRAGSTRKVFVSPTDLLCTLSKNKR